MYGNRREDLVREDMELIASDADGPVNLNILYLGMLEPGAYYAGFRYDDPVTEILEIEITVLIKGDPLDQTIPVKIYPQ